MKNLDNNLRKSCLYLCVDGEWEFIGGTAPPGYTCPDLSATGGCTGEGETTSVAPELTSDEPNSKPLGANLASYQYHAETDYLYFSEGKAELGYKFLPKLSLAELWERFPSIARDVEILKNAKSITGFSIEIPAIAIAHETK